jgi:hypothetical protein
MPMREKRLREVLGSLAALLILLSLACALPFSTSPTPASTQASNPTALPAASTLEAKSLPPALVESQPPPGAEIPLQGPITLYFNQPMDPASVQAAIHTRPQVPADLVWGDNATLTFTPQQPLDPNSSLTVQITSTARSSQGVQLSQPVSLTYQTAGYLKLAHALPEPGSQEVDPGAAILASFDHPVIAGGQAQAAAPAFQLAPQAEGQGAWLNGSTYAFYPNPPLQGGIT